jgi:hypothetical protein
MSLCFLNGGNFDSIPHRRSIEVSLQVHRGHVFFNEQRFGATLRPLRDHLRLEVSDAEGTFGGGVPEQVDLLHFRSSTSYFSLLHLQRISANQARRRWGKYLQRVPGLGRGLVSGSG